MRAVIAQFLRENTEVRVFHADEWPSDPADLAFTEGLMAASEIVASHIRKRREDAEALAARAAKSLQEAGFQTSTIVRPGDPRHGIIDCAAEWHADLIVLGSHGRRGIDRFLLGSVSDSVVRHARCSVEIVRAN